MHPKFLFDENVSDILWKAVQDFNARAIFPIEAIRVGDPADLSKHVRDPEILLWAESNGYILSSHDKKTLPVHLADHTAAGHHLPGLFLFSYHTSVDDILELLAVAARSENPLEWQDLIEYFG